MAEYDTLYLQQQEHIAGLPIVQPWQVNDDDVEYMPSTPRNAAADAMYEALEGALYYLKHGQYNAENVELFEKEVKAALALAGGD